MKKVLSVNMLLIEINHNHSNECNVVYQSLILKGGNCNV